MIDTQDEDENSPLEYLITGLVILFFGGLYFFINHFGDNDTGQVSYAMSRSADTADVDVKALSAAERFDIAEVSSKASNTTEVDAMSAQTVEAKSTQIAVNDALESDANAKQQALAALEAEKSKLQNEITVLKADRDDLVDTNTALNKEADAALKQLAAAKQATPTPAPTQPALKQQAVKSSSPNNMKAGFYQLPDGTEVAIGNAGFEGLLKQALEAKTLNTPIIFDAIYFDSGSAQPTDDSQRQIRTTAALMNTHQDINVLIKGHTDNSGNTQSNTLLSLTRSGYMKKALVNLGINSRRIQVEGVGSQEPIAPNDTEDGRNSNRRVELILVD